jgi:YggT family protein
MLASNPVLNLLSVVLTIAWILLLIRVIVSWIEYFGMRLPFTGPFRSAYDLLIEVTEFGLRPLRKIVPPTGMFDISVLVAFVIIFVAQQALRSAGG